MNRLYAYIVYKHVPKGLKMGPHEVAPLVRFPATQTLIPCLPGNNPVTCPVIFTGPLTKSSCVNVICPMTELFPVSETMTQTALQAAPPPLLLLAAVIIILNYSLV